MKSLFSIALFLFGLVSPAVSAQLEVKGLLVYHPPGHTDSYIEVIPFNQNSKKTCLLVNWSRLEEQRGPTSSKE